MNILRPCFVLIFIVLSCLSFGQAPIGYTAIVKRAITFTEVENGETVNAVWGQHIVIASMNSLFANVVLPNGMIGKCSRDDIYISVSMTMKDLEAKVNLASEILDNEGKYNTGDDPESLKEWSSYVALYARRITESSPSTIPAPQESESSDALSDPTVKLTNSTKYKLVVSFVGPKTLVRNISPNATVEVTLRAGEYKLVVTAPGSSVTPLHATHVKKAGWNYSHNFYIKTSRG